MSIIQHKRGRQTRAERIQTRKNLQPHFEKRVPSYKAAQITGYNVKTVNKHYQELYMEIYGYETKNFVKRIENERINCILYFEKLIQESYDMLESIMNSIRQLQDRGEIIPLYLIQSHSKVIQNLSHLVEKKSSLIMHPDAGDMIDEEVAKRIGKHV